jgi:DNA relaxase NicK
MKTTIDHLQARAAARRGKPATGLKTTIDYLTFRAKAEPPEVLQALRPMFGTTGADLTFRHLPRGAMGFQQASQIVIGDMPVARLDFGGESQRGWVRTAISGQGCEWVQDWDAVCSVEELPEAQPRRLDIALTTWDGEIGHERIVQAHQDGQFHTGGRPPDLQQITSSNDRAGRTCYVGKRTSDKFFRAYEKGFEMVGKMGRMPGSVTHIDGHRVEDIYRCELELKASCTPIGWDVIERRDEFFAGAYPFCGQALPGVEPDILMRRKERAPQTDLAVALENCRIQFGPTLYTALRAYMGDIGAVWEKVVGDHHAEHLLEAGVLLVDHN